MAILENWYRLESIPAVRGVLCLILRVELSDGHMTERHLPGSIWILPIFHKKFQSATKNFNSDVSGTNGNRRQESLLSQSIPKLR